MAPGTAVSMKLAQQNVDVGLLTSFQLTPPDSAEIVEKPPMYCPNDVDHHQHKHQVEEPEVASARAMVRSGKVRTDSGTQTDYDPVVVEAKAIFLDIWNLVSQRQPYGEPKSSSSSWKPRSGASLAMYRVAGQLLDKHSIIYGSVVDKLKLVGDNERIDYFAFRVVSDEVLNGPTGPPQVTWGRIVALYALFMQVARDCHQRGQTRTALVIADYVGIYVGERISSWITEKGGWGALERTFPAEDHVEQKVWKGLLVTGIGLGMLATAIKAIR